MDFLDSLLEEIGQVVLLILGIIILIVGVSFMVSRHEIIGFIVLIIGVGVIVGAKSYSRSNY
jgi:uncharacterized membrane protein